MLFSNKIGFFGGIEPMPCKTGDLLITRQALPLRDQIILIKFGY